MTKASGTGSANYSQLIMTQHMHEPECQTVPQKFVEKLRQSESINF